MPRKPFHELPDPSRLWVFPVSRPLNSQEEDALLGRVDGFLDEWTAHGSPLSAGRDWREGRFLLVAVDESTAPPSGCSIDALVKELKAVGGELGADLLDHAPVWYRENGEVRRVSRPEFKILVEARKVNLDTPVFDHAITRLQELRSGEWEKPAGASWHRRAFFRNAG